MVTPYENSCLKAIERNPWIAGLPDYIVFREFVCIQNCKFSDLHRHHNICFLQLMSQPNAHVRKVEVECDRNVINWMFAYFIYVELWPSIYGKHGFYTFIRSTKIWVFAAGSVKTGRFTPRSSVVGSRRPTVVVVVVDVVETACSSAFITNAMQRIAPTVRAGAIVLQLLYSCTAVNSLLL